MIQSMTNTDTADIESTTQQCLDLCDAGSELIRLTVNTSASAKAVPAIKERLLRQGYTVPLVGDFHYNGHKLLQQEPACAEALAKFRINPGNVGRGDRHAAHFASIIEAACRHGKAIRIGVNWGSLDQELLTGMMDENANRTMPLSAHRITCNALIASALQSAKAAVDLGLPQNRIILSCKVSEVRTLLEVYRDLAELCEYPLHIGLTEAGMGIRGIVSSTAAISLLLNEGIGDTIRVSITPQQSGDRCDEVRVALNILQSMGLRHFAPSVTACPGCGRTNSSHYQKLAETIQDHVNRNMKQWKKDYQGVENLKIAVMGCIVNGPGESRHADVGISLPGSGEDPVAPVFIDGEKVTSLKGERIAEDFQDILDGYIKCRFSAKTTV